MIKLRKILFESNIQKLKKIKVIQVNVDEINASIVDYIDKAYTETTDADADVQCNTTFELKDDRYVAIIELTVNKTKSKIIGDVNLGNNGIELTFTYKITNDNHFYKKTFKYLE